MFRILDPSTAIAGVLRTSRRASGEAPSKFLDGRTWTSRYGFAVAAAASAMVLTWIIWGYIKPQVSPLFFVAVLSAAWYGGLGPGLLATGISGFTSIYFFSDPVFSVDVG